MSSETLLTLIFGGLGGAALTFIASGAREGKRGKREDEASHWLVTMELANANAGAEQILKGEPYTSFPMDAWREERSRLARALPREGFLALTGAYDAIHGFNWRFDAEVFTARAPADALLVDQCEQMRDASGAALEVLDLIRG